MAERFRKFLFCGQLVRGAQCFRSRSRYPWYWESVVEQEPEPQDSNLSLKWGLCSWPLSCNCHCHTWVRNCCHAVPMPALEDTLETNPQDLTLCLIPVFSSELEGTLCEITQQSDLSTCSWSRWEGQTLGRASHPAALSTCLHVLGSSSCSGCTCSAKSWWTCIWVQRRRDACSLRDSINSDQMPVELLTSGGRCLLRCLWKPEPISLTKWKEGILKRTCFTVEL